MGRVLLAGDAAGLVLNTGTMVRGMDLALASGERAEIVGPTTTEAYADSAEKAITPTM